MNQMRLPRRLSVRWNTDRDQVDAIRALATLPHGN